MFISRVSTLQNRTVQREREREKTNRISSRLLTGPVVISLAPPAWGEAGFFYL